MKVDAQITILSSYDDSIKLKVYDKTSGVTFLDMTLTREQFINATMNRLGNTDVKSTYLCHLDKVGKTMEMQTLEFEMPDGSEFRDKEVAAKIVHEKCPDGWTPDTGFSSQNSFFTKMKSNGRYARTTIRRWV